MPAPTTATADAPARRPTGWTAPDDGVLTIGQVRIDLEREAATERLRQRERQQAVLARFAREALACRDLAPLFDVAARDVAQTLGAELVGALELARDGHHVLLRAGVGWQDGLVGHALVPAAPGTPVRLCLESGPLAYTHRRDHPFLADATLLGTHGAASGAVVPIPGRLRPHGLLEAHTAAHREFSADDLAFLDAMAHTLASAMERCAAEEQAEQGRRDLEALVAERTRQLAVSNRELEAFSYSVSHDLREPLRAIHGFSTLLEQRVGERVPEALPLLDSVRASAAHLGRLIDDLLDLSRVQRADLVRTAVDLSRLAEQALAERAHAEPSRAVEWHVQPGLVCQGDALLLRTLLENLLANAWKYTAGKPAARIDVTRQEGGPICVRDNGAGFDMAYAGKLFRPFERLHTAAEFAGTGIGLATVARIVERHGGRVWAEGRPGDGAAFYFTLEPESDADEF